MASKQSPPAVGIREHPTVPKGLEPIVTHSSIGSSHKFSGDSSRGTQRASAANEPPRPIPNKNGVQHQDKAGRAPAGAPADQAGYASSEEEEAEDGTLSDENL